MATRSNIIVLRSDGVWSRQYCHFDGYLSGVGVDLDRHYRTQAKVERLAKLGALSFLAAKPNRTKGHTYATPVPGHVVAYGRDRGDKDCGPEIFDSLAAAWPDDESWIEFVYVWRDGAWFWADALEGTQALRPLADELRIIQGRAACA